MPKPTIERSTTQAEEMRQQRNQEVRQLIGSTVNNAKAIFAQNTAAGQLTSKMVKTAPAKPVRNSITRSVNNQQQQQQSPEPDKIQQQQQQQQQSQSQQPTQATIPVSKPVIPPAVHPEPTKVESTNSGRNNEKFKPNQPSPPPQQQQQQQPQQPQLQQQPQAPKPVEKVVEESVTKR